MSNNFQILCRNMRQIDCLAEAILESVPQLCIQIYMISYCLANTCNFEDDDKSNKQLTQAFFVTTLSVLYRMGTTMYEVRQQNISLQDYFRQLIKMGDGVPLQEIVGNEIEHLDLSYLDLSLAQIRLLGKALQHNSSLQSISLKWVGEKKMNC